MTYVLIPGAGCTPWHWHPLTEELERLTAAEALAPVARRRYLSDLASRLRVISQMVGGHPGLTTLADDLDRAELATTDLDALWTRTRRTLTELTPSTRPTRSFWKRT